jgi:hypothetical protein
VDNLDEVLVRGVEVPGLLDLVDLPVHVINRADKVPASLGALQDCYG